MLGHKTLKVQRLTASGGKASFLKVASVQGVRLYPRGRKAVWEGPWTSYVSSVFGDRNSCGFLSGRGFLLIPYIKFVGLSAALVTVAWVDSSAHKTLPAIVPKIAPDYRSGRLNLKVPRTLHTRLAETAEHEGISMNQLIVYLLAGALENR